MSSSEEFSVHMLRDLLEEDYLIIQLFVKPADLGLTGAARSRTYIFCAHRTECRYLVDVYETYSHICQVLQRKIHTRPRDYFVASQQQIQSDAMRLASVRGVAFKPDTWFVSSDWGYIPQTRAPILSYCVIILEGLLNHIKPYVALRCYHSCAMQGLFLEMLKTVFSIAGVFRSGTGRLDVPAQCEGTYPTGPLHAGVQEKVWHEP